MILLVWHQRVLSFYLLNKPCLRFIHSLYCFFFLSMSLFFSLNFYYFLPCTGFVFGWFLFFQIFEFVPLSHLFVLILIFLNVDAYRAILFLQRNAFSMSQRFCCVVFSFSFSSKKLFLFLSWCRLWPIHYSLMNCLLSMSLFPRVF